MNNGRPHQYNPLNWYWEMEESAGRIWSSAESKLVSTNDHGYQKWSESNVAPKMTWTSLYDLMLSVKPSAADIIARKYGSNLDPTKLGTAFMTAGCSIESESNPDLNGTYPIDVQKITAISSGLSLGKELPKGMTAITWTDVDGKPHKFSKDEFIAFANAMVDYAYNLAITENAKSTGQKVSWPAQPIQIP